MRPLLCLAATMLTVTLLTACGAPPEVCGPDGDVTPRPLAPHATAGLLAAAHAHNDYEHPQPLDDALAAGFHSVEADVFFAGGRFEVSHYGIGAKGTLESLYLQPLQTRVDAQGPVHPGGAPFYLWVDLKDSSDDLVPALHALLDRFPMLTVFDDGDGVTQGAVTVVLTGDAKMKQAFVESGSRRSAIRDSNDLAVDDPPGDTRWGFYALKWSTYVDWDGNGPIPQAQSERLACIVNRANASGRKVRFFGGPDRPEVWDAWIAHGVHFLHTDSLEALRRHVGGD